MKITDIVLAAYVDGALPAAERAAVEAAAERDPQIAERLEGHRRFRTRVAGAFDGALDEAAPQRLMATIADSASAPDNVVDLGKARRQRAPQPEKPKAGWLAWSAIAACLALVVVLAQSRLSPPSGPLIAYGTQGLTAKGALAGALDKQLVSAPPADGEPVRILLSFRSNDGRFCRCFQIQRGPGLAGVACRDVDGWRVMATAASAVEPSRDYRTAGSTAPTAVLATVSGMIAGSALDAAGETAARSRGWRP